MLSSGVQGAVFNIPNGDVAALIAAINTANTNREADVINLAPNGLYILTSIYYTSPNPGTTGWEGARGLPKILDDVNDTDIIFNGNGATIRRSLMAPEFGIIAVGGQVIFNNIVFRNGKNNSQGAAVMVMYKKERSSTTVHFTTIYHYLMMKVAVELSTPSLLVNW